MTLCIISQCGWFLSLRHSLSLSLSVFLFFKTFVVCRRAMIVYKLTLSRACVCMWGNVAFSTQYSSRLSLSFVCSRAAPRSFVRSHIDLCCENTLKLVSRLVQGEYPYLASDRIMSNSSFDLTAPTRRRATNYVVSVTPFNTERIVTKIYIFFKLK